MRTLDANDCRLEGLSLSTSDSTPIDRENGSGSNGKPRDADWKATLTKTAHGSFAASTANLLAILRHDEAWDTVLSYNERSGQILLRSPPPWRRSECESWAPTELRDSDYPRIADWFERSTYAIAVNPSSDALRGAITVAAEDRRFDPVVDYLNSLAWDGAKRLDNLLSEYFGAGSHDDDDDDDGDDNEQREYLSAIGARALIAAVARAYEPGCQADHALTLVGAQGAGKSTGIKTLAGDGNYADSLPDLRDKDAADSLRGLWIVELSELDSISRAELSTAKAFLSRTHDRFRAAYGRQTESHARRCVFIATTNEDAFLADATGNRRFWPVTVGRIDLEGLRRDRDQLWAEAVARYRAGEPWHLDTKELAEAAIHAQANRQIVDLWQPAIAKFVAGHKRVSVQDVLASLALNLEHCGQVELNRVARVLRQLGWTRRQFRDGDRRIWLYAAPPKEKADQ